MNEFRYLNYCTVYRSTGSITLDKDTRACFGHIFDAVDDGDDITYYIEIHMGISLCAEQRQSNACLISKDEIRKHIRVLNDLYPITYRVYSYRDSPNKVFVRIRIKDAPATFHKYALTWIRYIYEFPFNTILSDVYKLRKDESYRFMSTSTLFNAIANCIDDPDDIGWGHDIGEGYLHSPLTRKQLRERLREVELLKRIYSAKPNDKGKIPFSVKAVVDGNEGTYSIHDIEYWSSELFNYRKNYYDKILK